MCLENVRALFSGVSWIEEQNTFHIMLTKEARIFKYYI
jgi:hypothetical protein